MKLIIDVPEYEYQHIKEYYEKNDIVETTYSYIYHGTPLEQEPKTGYWEWVQYDSNPNIGNWHCSECRTIIPHMPEETDNTPIYKWCPMCGAKMESEG